MRSGLALLAFSLLCPALTADPAAPRIDKGRVKFAPAGDQKNVPEIYQLQSHEFDFEMESKYSLPASGIDVFRVRFPSPVESPHKENNTVHAEYYLPRGKGPFPAVIVLDITGGDQALSRSICTHLAKNNVAGLFVQMAYYGPRRPANSRLRLLSTDVKRTISAVRQTVLDMRRATAWMESRPELDPKRLGILGTSLGSFMATLTAEVEPKLRRVANLLGGGGLVDGYYDHPQAAPVRSVYETLGGSKDQLKKLIAPYDPITLAGNLKDRELLILAGKRDEIVPPSMAEALWKAAGEQKIVWFDCTHYGAAAYLVPALEHIVKHFGAP